MGFTIPRIDSILVPYAEKSFNRYRQEFLEIKGDDDNRFIKEAEGYAMKKVKRDMEQGFQGLEYKFNTVGSSRGDYPKQYWGII